MKEITMYVGKNKMVKVDLENVLGTEVAVLQSIPYGVASKYPEFISAIEVCIEDCLSVDREIINDFTYGLAIADLVTIINNDSEMEEETMSTTTNNATVNTTNEMEEVVMTMEERIVGKDGKFSKEGIKEVIVDIAEGMSNICDDMKEDVAPHVEQVKGYLVSVSGILGILGLTKLKADYDKIIYAGLDEKGNLTQIDKMVKQITFLFKEEIKRLNYFATEKTLAQSFALKCMVGDTYTDKNIFECIFAGLLNVINKVVKFVKEKYNLLETKAKSIVIKAILKGIRCLFGALIQGGLIIIKFIGHGISFIIAGVTAIGYWAYNTIKKLFAKIGQWFSKKFNKDDDIEVDLFNDFEDEAEPDVFNSFDDVDDNGVIISSADVVIEAYED